MKDLLATLSLFLIIAACVNLEHPDDQTKDKEKEQPILKFEKNRPVTEAHIRGLYLVDEKVGWASGSNGTFLRMTDGDRWDPDTIHRYTHLDFRDIHGFDAMNAIIMAAGAEGRILRTANGGGSWEEVYTNLEEGIFLDGIDFDGDVGYCIGDPLNGSPFILVSKDQGRTWNHVEQKTLGMAIEGEGSYAASGTTVVRIEEMTFAAYSGDSLIRVLRNEGPLDAWESVQAPLRIGEGCGIFSMAFKDANHGVAVGGCYMDSLSSVQNCALTSDAGITWSSSSDSPPKGYRSCVAYAATGGFYLTCGRTGIDVSFDDGHTWEPINSEGYYSCAIEGNTAWLMGRRGKMSKILW